MEKRRVIQNIIVIAVILAVMFLSQQQYFINIGQIFYPKISDYAGKYWVQVENWLKTNIYLKVSREVEEKRGVVEEEIIKQKNNIFQNIWEKIKNYFAEKFSKTFNIKVE